MSDIYFNPLVQRIQGGTVQGDLNLCASCRFAIKREGSMSGFSETRCSQLHGMPRVPEKLAACTMYLEKGKLSLGEMIEIAWVIEAKGKHIGFITPEELARRRGNAPPQAPAGF